MTKKDPHALDAPSLATTLVGLLVAGALALACGHPAPPPTPEHPAPLPEARVATTQAEPDPSPAEAPDAGHAADAGEASIRVATATSATAATPSSADAVVPIRNGPVLDDADAVARASHAANAALDKSYVLFVKKAQVAPTHSGPWTRSSPSVVKGNLKAGWDVTFSSFPPAGFSHEAVVHVGPRGDVTVKKASVSYSAD